MTKAILFAALLGWSGMVCAQAGAPAPDLRIRRIDYIANQVVPIEASPGYQLTINLAPDERIETVALGNSGAFQVTASRGGDVLILKALQAGAMTNMTVVTDVRHYSFNLTASSGEPKAYAIEFQYPTPPPLMTAPTRLVGSYKLAGSKSLWPDRISDDGEHVFIDWPANIDLPAIYALDGQGRESLTNGMMRGDHIVIDAIAPQLVFRASSV